MLPFSRDIVQAELARRSLADFVRLGWHVLEPSTPLAWNWHIKAICQHVQAVLEDWIAKQADPTYVQRIQNLLVNVPPGTMKSRILVYATAWMWLRCPSWRVVCLSANPRVALRDSMFARELVGSTWYRDSFQPTWRIADGQDAKGLFANSAGGARAAMGMDSRIVGERYDAIFVDDPHDAQEVLSEPIRRGVLERWDTAIANRVNDLRSSVRIGICQRVHEEDWSAHVLAQCDWAHVRLPLEFESTPSCACRDCTAGSTALGWSDPRTEGECLHPERFPPRVIETEKRRLGSYAAAGQLQQRPAPADGGMVKTSWWRFEPPRVSRRPVSLSQAAMAWLA